MPFGMNSNGSGVIALLELIRIFSKFYENYENVIKYDILFVLTSGGALNYEGTQHFINNLDSTVSDNLQYVLCLDTIAGSHDMNMHVSRFPKENDEHGQRLYKVSILNYLSII
jgi:Zn-dependent M28 family amino/carboxypeptidase